jgi:hypothetical protein
MQNIAGALRQTTRGEIGVIQDVLRWISRKYFYLLGVVVIVFLFWMAFSEQTSSDAKTVSLCLITIIFISMMCLWLVISRRERVDSRLMRISSSLKDSPMQAKMAEELYLSSQYYLRKAARNNFYSVVVLAALGVSVVFAGYALNLDTVNFGTADNYRRATANALEAYQSSVTGMPINSDLLRSQPDEYKKLVDAQATALASYNDARAKEFAALDKQNDAAASMFHPSYRIASAIIIRMSMIGVAIYLVILLNRAYKFNSAMASFYTARLMATLNDKDDGDSFTKRAQAFSPDLVSYDADIEHPLDKIKDMFEKVLESFASDGASRQKRSQANRQEVGQRGGTKEQGRGEANQQRAGRRGGANQQDRNEAGQQGVGHGAEPTSRATEATHSPAAF